AVSQIQAERAQRAAPAHPGAVAVDRIELAPVIECVAGVIEHRGTPLRGDPACELYAAHQQIAPAYRCAILRDAQALECVTADAGVAAGAKHVRRGDAFAAVGEHEPGFCTQPERPALTERVQVRSPEVDAPEGA